MQQGDSIMTDFELNRLTDDVLEVVAGGGGMDDVARQVLAGQWGNGQERINRLTAAGYDAGAVKQAVDNMVYLDHLRSVATPEYMDVARQVLAGQWGNGSERKARLEAAGYNYNDIQGIVANLLR